MIVNKLKPCCEDCHFIDGSFYTDEIKDVVGNVNIVSTIYCEHMAVCAKYIGHENKEYVKDVHCKDCQHYGDVGDCSVHPHDG